MKALIIGGVSIPDLAALELQQTYEPIGGEMTLRTIGGSAIKQITWQKWRTTITGGGWLPFGLSSLDYSAQMAVACIVPRGVVCSGLSATLPAARRSDTGYVPWGVALMADQTTQITAATMAGNVATLDAVAGAIGYHAMYYPLLQCYVSRPKEQGVRETASYGWSIVAEEA